MFEGKRILLIGGAPRSGTTMLLSLLDSHPEVLAFPLEHGVLETFYGGFDKSVFLGEFIKNSYYGQQAFLSSADSFEAYSTRIKRILGLDVQLEIDTDAFRNAYLQHITQEQITLERIFHALIFALCRSSDYYQKKIRDAKYLVFKRPFYTELYAARAASDIDGLSVIHIVRDVYERYSSAKARRVNSTDGRVVDSRRINKLPSALGHCEISIVSSWLAENAPSMLDSYFVLAYRELSNDNNCASLRALLRKLCLNDRKLVPMSAGERVQPNTSYVFDSKKMAKKDRYFAISNSSERVIVDMFLATVAGNISCIDVVRPTLLRFLVAWVLRMRNESWRDYRIRIALSPYYIYRIFRYNPKDEVAKIPDKFIKRNFSVSGET